jgi:hypothetical protein
MAALATAQGAVARKRTWFIANSFILPWDDGLFLDELVSFIPPYFLH